MPDPAAILAPILRVSQKYDGDPPPYVLAQAIHEAKAIAAQPLSLVSSPDGHCQACGKRSASATCPACVKAVEDKPWRFGVGTLITVFVLGGGIGWVVGLAVGHGMPSAPAILEPPASVEARWSGEDLEILPK